MRSDILERPLHATGIAGRDVTTIL